MSLSQSIVVLAVASARRARLPWSPNREPSSNGTLPMRIEKTPDQFEYNVEADFDGLKVDILT
jgi:hypothetical protein